MQKIIDYMNLGLKYILNVILTVLVIAVVLQVFFRYVVNNPIAWTEELSRYSLVWLTFLGAAYAVSLKQNISIEILRNVLSPLGKKVMYTIATLVSLLFCIFLIQYGYILASSSMNQLSPVLQVPMGVIYYIIPVSAFLFGTNLISMLVQEWKKEDNQK